MFSRHRSHLKPISGRIPRIVASFAALLSGLVTILYGTGVRITNAAGVANRPVQAANEAPSPEHRDGWTKVAEGEYAIFEEANDGAVGPFEQEVYNFRESWKLWRAEKGEYQLEGTRTFESPKDELHTNPFVAELSRDLTVVRVKEFARLIWVRDSGPLSCEFLPAELDCSSGGSDPKRSIQLQTHLDNPYGLLWPISPFSLSGVTREVERDPRKSTEVDFVRIEQPSADHPVETTVLTGPLRYLGEEGIEAAGRKWQADKFSLKVAFHPEYLIWTSPRGLLLALAIEHQHKNWASEGMRLTRFQSSMDF